MSKQQKEVFTFARQLAEEQVLFLRSRYKMLPEEIVHLYTGASDECHSYDEAVESVYKFNMNHASQHGFLAG